MTQKTLFSVPLKMNLQIINKSGGLIFSLKNNQSNSDLIFASSLHTIYAHVQEVPSFSCFEFDLPFFIYNFDSVMSIYRTLGGHTFVFTTDTKVDASVYRKTANLFIDYVLKNPFYQHEMPVNCNKFRDQIVKLLESKKK